MFYFKATKQKLTWFHLSKSKVDIAPDKVTIDMDITDELKKRKKDRGSCELYS